MQRFNSELEVSVGERSLTIDYSDNVDIPDTVPAIGVHGWGCHKGDLDDAAERLANDGFRLVTCTFPSGERLTTNDRLDIIGGVATKRNLGRFGLIGHSMGGDDITEYATRNPSVVAGLADIAGSHDLSDRYLTGIAADMTEDEFADDKGFSRLLDHLLSSTNLGIQKYANRIAAFSTDERRAYHFAAVESVKRARGGGSLQDFFDYAGPKYYIHGQADMYDYQSRIRERHDIEYVEIPDADHFPNVDQPDAFARAIGLFMRTIQLF